jgi:hypothetical protein
MAFRHTDLHGKGKQNERSHDSLKGETKCKAKEGSERVGNPSSAKSVAGRTPPNFDHKLFIMRASHRQSLSKFQFANQNVHFGGE